MEKKPKLSVCMIAYNVEKFIGEAIEGVLQQTADFEIELLISNDNSQDNTEKVVEKYINEHVNGHWIRYKRQEKNLGSTLNYLWVLEHCQGEYIAFCDGDDYWTDSFKLQKQINFLENTKEFIGSFHNRRKCDVKGNGLSSSIQEKEKRNWDFDGLVSIMPEIPSASVVFRKPLNFALPEEFKKVVINGDTFLWVYVLQFGDFYYDAQIGPSVYRIHSQGLWSTQSSFKKSELSYSTYLLLDSAFPNRKSVKLQLFQIRFHLFYYAIKGKKWGKSLGYYFSNLMGLVTYPSGIKVFLEFHKSLLFK
ncbi:MAG: glycosyltransferase [Cyclobacterium sp.]|uniref:glycosyltransferase n=1 Tax=unclassified Cyclobacterium TaxID=2615055 RepID=UPI0013D1BBAF|nr:glycosyltransferase [Cyclobacterium sp. SYSU L10401]